MSWNITVCRWRYYLPTTPPSKRPAAALLPTYPPPPTRAVSRVASRNRPSVTVGTSHLRAALLPPARCRPHLGFARIFPGLVANFLSRFCTASRQISHLFLEKFISVLHSLEANISFISREIYLGFAQPRGKYLIYFSSNLSRFCTASMQISHLFLEKFSFPPHFRCVVGAHGHYRLIRRGVQQSGRNRHTRRRGYHGTRENKLPSLPSG